MPRSRLIANDLLFGEDDETVIAADDILGPLAMTSVGSDVLFFFVDLSEGLVDLPETFEADLARQLEAIAVIHDIQRVILDFRDVRGVTGRQVGAMMALRRAAQPYGCVILRNVSKSVRYILNLARVFDLFDCETEDINDPELCLPAA